MELLMYYRKIASKYGWIFVSMNFLKMKHELETIKLISEKFGTKYLFDEWIKHPHLLAYSSIISMVRDFDSGRGQNYQISTRKIFGAY